MSPAEEPPEASAAPGPDPATGAGTDGKADRDAAPATVAEPPGDIPASAPDPDPDPASDTDPAAGELSRVQRGIVGLVALLMAAAVVGHFGATFFHVAPRNVIRDEYGMAIRGYLYPEFRQGWSLFAPDLPRSDTEVHARVLVRNPDGTTETTEWINLTAVDAASMRHNVLPSRTRHQLRKGWTAVQRYQGEFGDPGSQLGADVRHLVERIALDRVPTPEDSQPEQIQFRSVSTPIPQPPWTPQTTAEPTVNDYDWWPVTVADIAGGADR
jgi:hypothetical protein